MDALTTGTRLPWCVRYTEWEIKRNQPSVGLGLSTWIPSLSLEFILNTWILFLTEIWILSLTEIEEVNINPRTCTSHCPTYTRDQTNSVALTNKIHVYICLAHTTVSMHFISYGDRRDVHSLTVSSDFDLVNVGILRQGLVFGLGTLHKAHWTPLIQIL